MLTASPRITKLGGGLASLVIRDETRNRSFRYHTRAAAAALGIKTKIPHEVGHLITTRTQVEKWDARGYDTVRNNARCSDSDV